MLHVMTGPLTNAPDAPRATEAVRLVPATEWDALVARLGGDDVYLRHGYHVASAHLERDGATPVLLHIQDKGGEVALPLLLRALPDGSGYDATSAYGYGGPAALGRPNVAAVGEKYDEWARANGVVATFLRLHPLLKNHQIVPPAAELIHLGDTIAWDISADRGELMPLMHTHHRRVARKADRAGMVTRITVNPTDLTGFRELYEHTMRRQEAADFYFFGDAYWDALVTKPGGDLVIIDGVLPSEEEGGEPTVVASLLCFAHGTSLHYHLGASSDAARNIGASNRCFLAAAEWAQSRAMTTFHLGGGVGAGTDSPLFVFKQRYAPDSTPRPFHIAKLVHDADRYRELAGTDSTAGYFPPWRSL